MTQRSGRAEAGRKRVLKAPAVRRAELLDCAQRLFLTRGYEATTVNDVIAETGLSKGAFYHHFRSKEDLLEAIADRYARDARGFIEALDADADAGPGALRRLNRLLSSSRAWNKGRIAELRAVFATLLEPRNAQLHHRIIDAVSGVVAPALTRVIVEGEAEGVFHVGDAHLAAEVLLGLSNARRPFEIAAVDQAATDLEAAIAGLAQRVRAEEALAKRVLGLKSARIDLLGPEAELREMLLYWAGAWEGASPAAERPDELCGR